MRNKGRRINYKSYSFSSINYAPSMEFSQKLQLSLLLTINFSQIHYFENKKEIIFQCQVVFKTVREPFRINHSWNHNTFNLLVLGLLSFVRMNMWFRTRWIINAILIFLFRIQQENVLKVHSCIFNHLYKKKVHLIQTGSAPHRVLLSKFIAFNITHWIHFLLILCQTSPLLPCLSVCFWPLPLCNWRKQNKHQAICRIKKKGTIYCLE